MCCPDAPQSLGLLAVLDDVGFCSNLLTLVTLLKDKTNEKEIMTFVSAGFPYIDVWICRHIAF